MKKKFLGRLLTMLLVAAMVFTLLPASAIAADWWSSADEYADDVSTQAATDETTDEFIRIFHLDCGRQYFSKSEIEHYIDVIAENNYTHLELALGNDALRFLLNDMSVGAYSSEEVTSKIKAANVKFRDFGTNELTESEMTDIIAYAKAKNISIIPLLNSPGHMDSILSAATALTEVDCSYSGSARTIDVTNATAVEFAKTLLQKYIEYFGSKGCRYFNIGADEYANDKTNGFSSLISNRKYGSFISYVNALADIIDKNGMTPMMFNDGAYYNYTDSYGTLNANIVICYWTSGWSGYSPASASYLANTKGHKIINTNDAWYYVLGRVSSGTYPYSNAWPKSSSVKCTDIPGDSDPSAIGCMQCIWADDANVTNSNETARVETLIKTFSQANSDYFVKTTPAEPEITIKPSTENPKLDSASGTASVTLDAGEVVTWTWDPTLVNLVSADSDISAYAATDASLEAQCVKVTPVEGTTGTATITASRDGRTAAFDIEVYDSSAPIEITLNVGGTREIPLSGDVTKTIDESKLDKSIATVTAKYNSDPGKTTYELGSKQSMPTSQNGTTSGVISDGNGNYLCISSGTISSATDINDATIFTVKKVSNSGTAQYTIGTADGYYLTVNKPTFLLRTNYNLQTVTTVSNKEDYWQYSADSGFKNNNYTSYYLTYGSREWTVSDSGTSTKGFLYSKAEKTTGSTDETVITITGKSVGTTYVTIDGTTYKINVLPEDISSVDPLKVEFWSTNRQVYANNNTSYISTSISAASDGVYSENGVLLSDFVPEQGTNVETKNENMVFWKGTRLTSDNKQTTTAGDNKTFAGDDFSYIRYWDGNWSFSADGQTWKTFNETDQVVAYYLQRTQITSEVTTEVVDWGEVPSTSYNSSNFVLLDFAVVRQSSSERYPVNPFPDSAKTQAFHCDPGDTNTVHQYNGGSSSTWHNNYRDLSAVYARASEQYEVYMITVTPTSTNRTTQVAGSANAATKYSYNYYDTETGETNDEKVIWVDDEANLGAFTDESTHYTSISGKYNYTVGGDPIVTGLEIFNRHGMLITYYVRSISKTALNVHYRELNATEDFYNYSISVKDGTVFSPGFNKADPSSTGKNSLLLVNNTVTSFDGTYEKAETVSADLSTMPQIGANYRYRTYTCVSVERSDDGKDVYLYYSFEDPKAEFVVDFGLPIEIKPEQVESSLAGKANKVTINTNAKYGKVTPNGTTVTYTPTCVLPENGDTFVLQYSGINSETGATNQTVAYQINIIPASNVLYEENFLTYSSTMGTTYRDWSYISANSIPNQASDQNTLYGFDNAYESSNDNSLGSAWTISDLTSGNGSRYLTTKIYGTGFDVIGTAGPNTGMLYVIYKGTTTSKLLVVDTSYSGKAGVASEWNKVTLHQVPLAHVEGLPEGEYEVFIRAVYRNGSAASAQNTVGTFSLMGNYGVMDDLSATLDELSRNNIEVDDIEFVGSDEASAVSTYAANNQTVSEVERPEGTTVTIDGFRVYRSSDNSAYLNSEKELKYVNVLAAVKSGTSAVTEFNDSETLNRVTYESKGGPQGEIYLAANQSAVFQTGLNAGDTIQISARAVTAAPVKMNDRQIDSNTEMYYEVTVGEDGVVAIANNGTGIMALGNLKVPSNTVFSDVTDQTLQIAARMMMAPVSSFDPFVNVSVKSVPVIRNKLVTLTITTTTDVAELKVNGKTLRPTNSWMVKMGWSDTYTYVLVDTVRKNQMKDYEIIASNAAGDSCVRNERG